MDFYHIARTLVIHFYRTCTDLPFEKSNYHHTFTTLQF